MRLSVSETAALLDAGEERVAEWIEDGSLPAQRILGEYRINRTELLEWATERQIALAPRAFGDALTGSGIPTVSEALLAGGITTDDRSADPAAVMRGIVQALPLAEEADREALLQFLLPRDSFGLSLKDDGIAVPQVRTPVILPVRHAPSEGSILTLTFLSRPLMIPTSGANTVVDSIFFLVSPSVTNHLALLSKLTACLNDEKFHAAVKRRRTAVDLVSAAAEVEARL